MNSLVLLLMSVVGVPPSLEIPAEIRPTGQYVILLPKTEAVAITYIGLSGIDPMPSVLLKDPRTFALDVRGLKEGKYVFAAIGSKADDHTRVDFSVVIGERPDVVTPTDPNHPPVPQPGKPLAGLRVLVLQETSPSTGLPRTQLEAIQSRQVIEYLDSKAISQDGKTRRWRKFDPTVAVTNLPKEWQDLRAAAQVIGEQPWVVIAGLDGGVEKVFYQGPYPQNVEEALAFFKRWGG